MGVEKSEKSKKTLGIALIALAAVIIAALLVWYFVSVYPARREAAQLAGQVASQLEQQQKTAEAVETVVSPPALQAENVTPATNPVAEKVPEVNPVERANPFKEEFENPFE